MQSEFVRSPLNYIGGKFKLLPQISIFFPKYIRKFVDLFAGGLNVAVNVEADEIICNDINHYLIDIYKELQSLTINELLDYIDVTIKKWRLSSDNEQAYLAFRNYYNRTRSPLDLYILICYSFNYQFRFNSAHEFNNPFGRNRSSFNPVIRNNLIKFHKCLKGIKFQSVNFKNYDISSLGTNDFVYCDPPYCITCGSYNDGKRGFEGWRQKDDMKLFQLLDQLHQQGCGFALSNVIEHKGRQNDCLFKWMDNYNVHILDFNYNNSNYQSKSKKYATKEVLVTNLRKGQWSAGFTAESKNVPGPTVSSRQSGYSPKSSQLWLNF